MRGDEALTRLCALVSDVGSHVFEDQHAHDCICRTDRSRACVEEPVMKFIEDAVREKMRKAVPHTHVEVSGECEVSKAVT
jgi:hypothetical protein